MSKGDVIEEVLVATALINIVGVIYGRPVLPKEEIHIAFFGSDLITNEQEHFIDP